MTIAQRTVIVVEDEADAAEMFAEMMRVNGFRVVKSFSSGPAINIIANEMPDLVILDVMMPDISGKTGMDAGASVYLTKPVGFLELKQAVEKVLADRKPA